MLSLVYLVEYILYQNLMIEIYTRNFDFHITVPSPNLAFLCRNLDYKPYSIIKKTLLPPPSFLLLLFKIFASSLYISGNCTAGYYCPASSAMPNPHSCDIGHYCPEHSEASILCPSGWYQPSAGQSVCLPCPESYYCDNSGGVVAISDAIKCPMGYYCPEGNNY